MVKKNGALTTGEFRVPAWGRVIITLVLLVVSGIFIAQKIDLTSADLGRHIRNGQVFFENFSPVKTNYYSYTQPYLPVVNHHWGTGVIYYAIYKAAGFTGLSLFNILIFTGAIFVFFRLAILKSNFFTAVFLTLFILPILANRAEIRPEIISNLFAGITFYILEKYRGGKIAFKKTLFLPVLMVFWVNLHIFFVMGLLIPGVYLSDSLLRRDIRKVKDYSILLSLSLILCLINPSGFRGFIEPFLIFREYGYRIVENQSLFFMQERFPLMPLYIHFEIAAVIFIAITLARIIKNRQILLPDAPGAGLLLLFTILGFAMIRVMPLFGFFFIPVMAGSIQALFGQRTSPAFRLNLQRLFLGLSVLLVLTGMFSRNYYYSAVSPGTGLGWEKKGDGSAQFFKNNNIKGPVLNNYDIGGYLIFHLFPGERVFVDNRPEAYTVSFFKDIYEPLQASEEKWKEMENRYHFNAIFFNLLDYTEHAQPFLIRRISDPEWAPVFVDDHTIILLKKNSQNEAIIHQYALPSSMFSIESNR
jgi:hypothetical protein